MKNVIHHENPLKECQQNLQLFFIGVYVTPYKLLLLYVGILSHIATSPHLSTDQITATIYCYWSSYNFTSWLKTFYEA